jgi:hypothetical protein
MTFPSRDDRALEYRRLGPDPANMEIGAHGTSGVKWATEFDCYCHVLGLRCGGWIAVLGPLEVLRCVI